MKPCACGCGEPVGPDSKGRPRRFIHGHNARSQGFRSKGGRYVNDQGYVMLYRPSHPRAMSNGYVREHVLLAEKALGRPLPAPAVVHHVDEDRAENTGANLVICEDRSYHNLVHARMAALRACGHADWQACEVCHVFDAPEGMVVRKGRRGAYHRSCAAQYQRERKARATA